MTVCSWNQKDDDDDIAKKKNQDDLVGVHFGEIKIKMIKLFLYCIHKTKFIISLTIRFSNI